MRSIGLSLSGVLVCAVSAAAQVSTLQVIEPALTSLTLGPRTLSPAIVSCTDLPTTTIPPMPLRIVVGHAGDTHQVYSPGQIVVLNGGTPLGYLAGQRYFVRRLQFGYDGLPPAPASPGAIRTAGWVTVVAADEHSTLARVDFACDNVEAGDYLEPFVEPVLPTALAADGPPNFGDMARVLFGPDRRQTFGAGDVLSMDRGKDRGLTLGTRVSFYRDRRNGTPLVEMGAGVVVELSGETAKVSVTRAWDAVMRGDYVAIRGAVAAP